jgi:hypothetical protein
VKIKRAGFLRLFSFIVAPVFSGNEFAALCRGTAAELERGLQPASMWICKAMSKRRKRRAPSAVFGNPP